VQRTAQRTVPCSASHCRAGAAHRCLPQNLIFYGVIGIKDPLRADVKEAVAMCHRAGINVRMVTGDNVTTARAIAVECGIVTSDKDVVVEGPVFRRMTPAEVDSILPRLKVMARSSPRDKNMLVRRLNGHLPEKPDDWEKVRAACVLLCRLVRAHLCLFLRAGVLCVDVT
jgi:hypothetical protein